MKQCERCGKSNPKDIHTCTPGLYFEKENTNGQTIYEQLQENKRIDKVLDDMEDIKFYCDMRYCNWEECKQQVKQSILKRFPTKSE